VVFGRGGVAAHDAYRGGEFGDLISAATMFELDKRSPSDGKPGIIYARDKRRRPGK
jgi:hypothetical protein